ncbi:MAG: hypothetical protein BLITH_1508 [Brockia lithotrophica]|uniref:Uncharacterized protein n=1 Tax=Brockia lithotrophica TaxID=933949 RepID=A0A2T5G5G6_9BACL|nr:hypothetical protein [Brockia lithotrophica]PTQ51431.1 MAG: hypothetical protein BLITH_1508 [Brockia lithotrophica]
MPRVRDVAAYILKKKGPLTKARLAAILLFAQGWTLAWRGSPLFRERIFRVRGELHIPGLCDEFSAEDWIHTLPGATWEHLTLDERQILDAVIEWLETHPDAEDGFLQDIVADQPPPFAEREFSPERSSLGVGVLAMMTGMHFPSSTRALGELSLESLRRRFEEKLAELLSRGCTTPGLFYLMCLLSRHRMHTDDLLEIRVWQEMNPVGREMW